MKRFLFIAFLLIPGHFIMLHSQNNDLVKRIEEQLTPSGKKSIAKAEEYLSKSDAETKLALQYEDSRKKKALQKQIQASKYLGKANKIKYEVYKEDLQKYKDKPIDSVKLVKKKLNRAKKIMKEARRQREESHKMNVAKNEYSLLKYADELEAKAFKDIYDVYAIYLEFDKNKTNKSDQEKENTVITDEKTENIDINTTTRQEITGKTVIASEMVLNNENLANQEIKNQEENSKKIENKEEQLNESQLQNSTYFKIQIAASKTQLSVEQLVKNFKTKEILNVEKEGEWYKYSIRKKFTDYDEALAYKNDLNIKGAFIIAFKNGNKVSIEEALKKDVVIENNPVKIEKQDEITTIETNAKIRYKLQIGLSISPLSPQEIKQFKNGGEIVTAYNCGSYLIYTVGDFETENAAINFKKLKSLNEAEVVKFKNDKLIEE